MTREQLEAWTDTAAYARWTAATELTERTAAGFEIPEDVRNDTVARLAQIVRRDLGKEYTTLQADDLAIRAALALAKIATTTATVQTTHLAALERVARACPPRATDEHSVFIQEMVQGLARGESEQ